MTLEHVLCVILMEKKAELSYVNTSVTFTVSVALSYSLLVSLRRAHR